MNNKKTFAERLVKALLLVAVAGCFFTGKVEAQSLTPVNVYKFDRPNIDSTLSANRTDVNPVVTSLTLSNDMSTFYVGGDDQNIYVWDLKQEKFRKALNTVNDWVRSVETNPLAGSAEIATLSQSGQLNIWDVDSTTPKVQGSDNIKGAHSLAYSPNGKVVAVCGYDPIVYFYDAATLQKLTEWRAPGQSSTTLVFSPNGQVLAIGGRNGIVRVWTTEDGEILKDFNLTNAGDAQNRRIRAVAISPSSKLLAAAGDANQIVVWDLVSGAEVSRIPFDKGKVFSMAFVDEDSIVTGDSQNNVVVWSVSGKAPIAIGEGHKAGTPGSGHTGTVATVVLDPSTNTILSSGFDTTVIRWSLP